MNDQPKQGSRHEFKYLIDDSFLPIFAEYLEKIGLHKDEAQDGSYPVTSLYFDTPFLNDYHDKVDGIKFRRKLRARAHQRDTLEAGPVWLEIKEKHDMNIRKIRGLVDGADFAALLAGEFSEGLSRAAENDKSVRLFLYHFFAGNYRPVNVIRYERTAYVERFLSEVRLTIDRSLETCTWHEYMDNRELLSPVFPEQAVMEVKFRGAMPWWFGDMCARFELARKPFSKYTHAINYLLRPSPLAR